jgi:hypothetical protein
MRKVRIGFEDVFIARTYHFNNNMIVANPIPDKYHFYFNPKWISHTSPTKIIAIRKIKVFPMTFVSIIAFDYNNNTMDAIIYESTTYSLPDNKNVLDLLDNFINTVNQCIARDFPNVYFSMGYRYNNGNVIFFSNFNQQLQFHQFSRI